MTLVASSATSHDKNHRPQIQRNYGGSRRQVLRGLTNAATTPTALWRQAFTQARARSGNGSKERMAIGSTSYRPQGCMLVKIGTKCPKTHLSAHRTVPRQRSPDMPSSGSNGYPMQRDQPSFQESTSCVFTLGLCRESRHRSREHDPLLCAAVREAGMIRSAPNRSLQMVGIGVSPTNSSAS
jgi:hypothetical protein